MGEKTKRETTAVVGKDRGRRMDYMKPVQIRLKIKRLKEKQKSLRKRCGRMEKKLLSSDLKISGPQSEMFRKIQALIEENHRDELERLLTESETELDDKTFIETMRFAWERDQKRNFDGSKCNRWSWVTIRLFLSIYARSPAAYKALQQFPFFSLPTERTLQRVLAEDYRFDSGPSEENISRQFEKYQNLCKSGGTGLGIGLLIFDETKLIGKLAYNSKSHEVYGTAISENKFASLFDVFEEYKGSSGSKLGQFALLTLWKDLTSNYEILGPYWVTDKTMDSEYLWSCLFESMRLFAAYNFQVIGRHVCRSLIVKARV